MNIHTTNKSYTKKGTQKMSAVDCILNRQA